MLTAGVDVLTPDQADATKKTTSGDDVIRGDITANDLATTDTVDGGAGNDTLNVLLNGAATPVIKNIEKIVLSAVTGASTLSLTDSTGIGEVSAKGTATGTDITVDNMATSVKVGVQGTFAAAQDATFTFKDVAGSNDTATLNVKEAVVSATGKLTVLAVENLNVVVSDDAATTTAAANANTIADIVATNTKTITLTGAAGAGGVTTLGTGAANNFAALTKFDASGFKGDLTVDFQTGAAAAAGGVTILASNTGTNTITMTTGTQADVIKFVAGNVSTISKMATFANFDEAGEDKVDLSAFALGADTTVGATAVPVAGDIAGFFTGTNRVVLNDTTNVVYVDINKDGNFNAGNDLAITLTGVTAAGFTAADLILA